MIWIQAVQSIGHKLKLTIFLLFSCVCICLVNSANTTTKWGNTTLKKEIKTKSSNYTFTFPDVSQFLVNNFFILKYTIFVKKGFVLIAFCLQPPSGIPQSIRGITHFDSMKPPVTVTFVKGNINTNSIAISLQSKSPDGIDSTFYFHLA